MEPHFIETAHGNIFALYHPPAPDAKIQEYILFIPPFGEELNRSRHMINRQARLFARAGWGVLLLDLYGTGDSEGTFGAATIDIWQDDILAAFGWLKDRADSAPILWAMRSGALLAADLLQKKPGLTTRMILWSPVTSGKRFITQFMRIKLAADMAGNSDHAKRSIKDLWAILEAGGNLEIAGYELSPKMAYGLAALSLNEMKLPPETSVKWIDISLTEPAELSPAARKTIDIWSKNHNDVNSIAVNDTLFWTMQEPEWANEYCAQTLMLVQKNSP